MCRMLSEYVALRSAGSGQVGIKTLAMNGGAPFASERANTGPVMESFHCWEARPHFVNHGFWRPTKHQSSLLISALVVWRWPRDIRHLHQFRAPPSAFHQQRIRPISLRIGLERSVCLTSFYRSSSLRRNIACFRRCSACHSYSFITSMPGSHQHFARSCCCLRAATDRAFHQFELSLLGERWDKSDNIAAKRRLDLLPR